nr:C39 family peptidase [Candidatus Hydrogenedentota bacterium]
MRAVVISLILVVSVTAHAEDGVMLKVEFFSQRDSHWSGDFMGSSPYKVGDNVIINGETVPGQGCAMTCVAMGLHYFGADTDPHRLNQWLSTHTVNQGGYDDNACINWTETGVGKYCQDIGCPLMYFTGSGADIQTELKRGYPVIIKTTLGT